jgi:hypothetical protein
MHRHVTKGALYLIVFLILLPVLIGSVSGENEQCHDCHGTDGDYTFEYIAVRSLTPRVVDPGSEFEHIIELDHPGEYDAGSISIELDISSAPDLTLLDKNTKQLSQFAGGKKSVSFKLKAGDSYNYQKIRSSVIYTVNYHYDPTIYTEILDISITVDEALLIPSAWTIDMKKGVEKKINFEVKENVKNISVIPSPTLEEIIELEYDQPQELSPGKKFSIKLNAYNTGTGKLNIVYFDEEDKPHKLTIDIAVTQKMKKGGDFWVQMGMITGILSWILLFISTIIGAPLRKVKVGLNKIFRRAVVRSEVHCSISYILVFLALFHAVIVMGNHWYGAMLNSTFIIANPDMEYAEFINLGTLSWIFMILVSVTGIFSKQLVKKMKYRPWRWTHNIITLTALVLAVTHGSVLLHARFF